MKATMHPIPTPKREPSRPEVLYIEYKTKKDDPTVVEKYLFKDKTQLTPLTLKAYGQFKRYMESRNMGADRPAPQSAKKRELCLQIIPSDNTYHFVMAFGENNGININDIRPFINALNDFIKRDNEVPQ